MGVMSLSDDLRRRELAAIHAKKKQLALTEDCYRAAVGRAARGRTDSAGDLSAVERRRLLSWFDQLTAAKPVAGARAGRTQHAKARALWQALWCLGAVADGSERALRAFSVRQTGIESPNWLGPEAAETVIEALKDWCRREGWPPPETARDGGRAAKVSLLAELLRRAAAIDPARFGGAVDDWLAARCGLPAAGLALSELDRQAQAIGGWLRMKARR